MSPKPRVLMLLLLSGYLTACTFWTDVRTKELSNNYRLKENAMAYICSDPSVPPRFKRGSDPKCLLALDRELAVPPQFPIGTPVKIVEIWKQSGLFFCGNQEKWAMAKLRVGEASKPVYVLASWPWVLKILEEVKSSDRGGGHSMAGFY
jgi:hypothetical protein